jgi:hypothetical protein
MNELQMEPHHLWEIYKLSKYQANELLLKLGFSMVERIEDLILYMAIGESFVLTVEGDLITQVQYKTTDSGKCLDCIGYAKNTMKYDIVFERFEQSADVLRLDSNDSTLIYIAIHIDSKHQSFGFTLGSKLPLPTTENKVEVILNPPPLPENGNNHGSSWW